MTVLTLMLAAALPVGPIEGDVKEACVAAVPIPGAAYFAASQDRPEALWDELRIRDEAGKDVPYVRRARQVRRERTEKAWRSLAVTDVAETNGELVVTAVLPEGERAPADRFVALRVSTPLRNYEQTVSVAVDGEDVARGTLSDYSRYANFSRRELALDIPLARRLVVTFATPVSEAEGEAFERTIAADGADGVTAKTVRATVVRRPFRIGALEVAFPTRRTDFEPMPDDVCEIRAAVTRDAKAKKTWLDFSTGGMPVAAVAPAVRDRNFSRTVAVLERRNGGWARVGAGRITAVDLSGARRSELRVPVAGLRGTALRLEIDDGDDPPLDFEDLPVRLFARPQEAVFIAKPSVRYRAELEVGASRPQYDSTLLDSVLAERAPQPLRLVGVCDGGGADAPAAMWLATSVDWIGVASVAAFAILGFVCWRLLKAK